MAKSESTRGKGAKDGEAGRAASGASSNGDGEGAGAAPSKAASKSAGGASPAKKSAAGGGGAAARKRPGGAGAGAGRGAGAGDGSPALEGGATAKKRSGGGAAGKSARGGGAGGGGQGDELSGHLREFARARPHGWGHDDWLRLLSELRGRGHDVSNEAGVGLQLERERLRHQLESVEGLTERQTASLVDRFGTFYSLRQASVDEIASVKGVNRQTAERIRERFG